jgi:hypothetical protein
LIIPFALPLLLLPTLLDKNEVIIHESIS